MQDRPVELSDGDPVLKIVEHDIALHDGHEVAVEMSLVWPAQMRRQTLGR